jgi:hypothetical protein
MNTAVFEADRAFIMAPSSTLAARVTDFGSFGKDLLLTAGSVGAINRTDGALEL